MRLLFVTQHIDWPPSGGGEIRQWNTLQALAKCGELDAVIFQPGRPVPAEVYAACRRVHVQDTKWLKFTPHQDRAYRSTLGRLGLIAGTRKPLLYLGPENKQLARWFAGLVAEGDYDVIWISRALAAMALDWRDPRRTILDGADFDCVLNYHLLRSSSWYGAKILNYVDVLKLAWWERQMTRWFARVARCSEIDQRLMPSSNVAVVPNGTWVPPDRERAPGERLLFVGTLGYEPNRAGLEWFLERIWPRVRQSLPWAEVDVVGNHASERIQARDGTDGVRVHGFVRELEPLWDRAALSIAPLLAGAGTRLKILESLAHGKPVVSTSIGAFGLDLGADEGVYRADDPEEFARRCVDLLMDVPASLAPGRRGKQAVASRYSWDVIQQKIQGLVREVAYGRGSANGTHAG
jgi:glycosyltransferase involved in cell wall biosynthesis